MVAENPKHDDVEVIKDKMLVIGRVYAAAVTRGAGVKDEINDGLPSKLYDHLAQSIKDDGSRLDKDIGEIAKLDRVCRITLKHVVAVHSYLDNQIVRAINSWQKKSVEGHAVRGVRSRISFVSKYLHFHAPMAVFIYDSISQKNLRLGGLKGQRVQWPEDWDENICTPYGNHCLRLLKYIESESYEGKWTPRLVDGHLLGYIKKSSARV